MYLPPSSTATSVILSLPPLETKRGCDHIKCYRWVKMINFTNISKDSFAFYTYPPKDTEKLCYHSFFIIRYSSARIAHIKPGLLYLKKKVVRFLFILLSNYFLKVPSAHVCKPHSIQFLWFSNVVLFIPEISLALEGTDPSSRLQSRGPRLAASDNRQKRSTLAPVIINKKHCWQTITWSNFTWSKLSFFSWSKFH
jgi:hypothetical protein